MPNETGNFSFLPSNIREDSKRESAKNSVRLSSGVLGPKNCKILNQLGARTFSNSTTAKSTTPILTNVMGIPIHALRTPREFCARFPLIRNRKNLREKSAFRKLKIFPLRTNRNRPENSRDPPKVNWYSLVLSTYTVRPIRFKTVPNRV